MSEQRQLPSKAKAWMSKYRKDQTIVLYCVRPSETTSARVAQELVSAGLKNIGVLKGGWNEWLMIRHPVEKK